MICEYTGKARYTRGEAQEAAKRSNSRRSVKGGHIRVEKCHHCGSWHLFHPAPPLKKGGEKKRAPRRERAWEGE